MKISTVAGLLLVGPGFQATAATAAGGVPYTDPSSSGFIGLCNQAGEQVTSGSVDTVPFAWRAVSSVPAKPPYNDAGRTATLFAFLPLEGFPPGDWSGETLTAASAYSNPTAPMAAATDKDESLEDFIEAYPPKWNGFIELRLYLDTTDQPAETKHYPTLNIQVSGDTWHAVGGGTVNCGAGTAISAEATLRTPSSTPATTQGGSGGSGGSGHSSGSGGSGGSAPTSHGSASSDTGASEHGSAGASGSPPATSPGSGPARGHGSSGRDRSLTRAAAAAGAASHPGSSAGQIAGIAAAALVVLGAGSYALTRRRRPRHLDPGGGPSDPQGSL